RENRGDRDNRNGQGGFNRDNRGDRDNRNGQGGFNRDNRGDRDNRNGQGGFNRDSRGDRDNRNGQGGFSRDNRGDKDNRNGQGGFNRDNRGDRDNRNGQGGFNRDNRGDRDNRNGQGGFNRDNRGDRDNRNGQGGFNRDNRGDRDNRNGQGGFNRDNRGDRDNRNFGGQGGFKNDNRGGFGGKDKDERDSRNGGNSFGRKNDRRDSAPKDEFIFETKPDSRRPDSRKDNKKNDRKKDVDVKENLKFANSQQMKKPVRKEEKEEETIKQLVLPDTLTIKELADKMKVQPSVLVKKLFMQGKIVTINQEIDFDMAEEIALEFNCICEHEEKIDVIAELLKEDEEPEDKLVARPPVVCVMGHVDHGKTSLLDAIRETHVTAKESGGITQKIGAYTVEINDHKITFLDTPGHEAFTAMRMRGAQSTDIAILVVAADDGVMPQTIEAINHAKAAGVEIIVAVNKIDKPSANVEKVKQELTEYELVAEDWGGSTIFVPVSAHTKQGIDELLEMILLTAEVHELKANPNRKARGIVIEAELDKGRGPVATVLVQKGTLKVGDNVAAGSCYGKIRAMIDDKGDRVREVGPSMPVEILGLNDVPNAGEILMAMDSDKEARNVAETFISEGKKKLLDDTKHKVSLDALFEQIQAGNVKELGIIIKADVQGSVEAVKQSLLKLSNEEVVVKCIHGGVGNINESDVVLASASNAIIIGFNVKPDNQARIVADREKVDLRLYSVIYNAIEDVEAALKGMLEPIYEEQVMGHAEIRQIFKASVVGNIAGSLVVDGKITKNSTARIFRDGEKIFEGPIATLKRFKDDVKEVKAGYECGLVFEKFGDIQEGDTVEAYEMVEVPR
ncbi:MAG: translation initiation factor IF-2, partial [Lachnospira sp.]|nr:translation initiation factor IF-2 [Lachnospira sp.]